MKRPGIVSGLLGAIALAVAVVGLALSNAVADSHLGSTASPTDPSGKIDGQGVISVKLGL